MSGSKVGCRNCYRWSEVWEKVVVVWRSTADGRPIYDATEGGSVVTIFKEKY